MKVEQAKSKDTGRIKPIDVKAYKKTLGDGSKEMSGLTSGFAPLDELTGGLEGLCLLAGRSGAGKTTLAVQVAVGVAEQGIPVIFYSLEMRQADLITKLVQNISQQLYRSDIDLRGNSKDLEDDKKKNLSSALSTLTKLSNRMYIEDNRTGSPAPLTGDKSMLKQVIAVKKAHQTDDVLVVVDSVQDIVPEGSSELSSERGVMNALVELEHKTGATILLIAQKNKSSVSSSDSYGDVMGSMSFIHKPNLVLDLASANEIMHKAVINKTTGWTREKVKNMHVDMEKQARYGKPKPMFISVLKGRYTSARTLNLAFYAVYGYFKEEKILRYDDVYKLVEGVE